MQVLVLNHDFIIWTIHEILNPLSQLSSTPWFEVMKTHLRNSEFQSIYQSDAATSPESFLNHKTT